MQIRIIAPPCVEATPGRQGKGAALSRGGAAMLDAGLVGAIEAAGGSVSGVARPSLPNQDITGDPIADLGRYNALIAAEARAAIEAGERPLLVGGTCSHLPGMIAGLQQALDQQKRLGLLWLDAHGDFNTPAISPSGMLGGMPVAVVAGLCHAAWRKGAGLRAPLPTNRIMMMDVRNLDPYEDQLIRATNVAVVRFASPTSEAEALERVRRFAASLDTLYVHIDADVLDVSLQPNHPTAEPDGLDVDQTLRVVEAAVSAGEVCAFGVVSVNPDEPGGAVSLASGMALLIGGVARWAAARNV
jgi:arginase